MTDLTYGLDPLHDSLAVGHTQTLRDLAADIDTLAACRTWADVQKAELTDTPFSYWDEDRWEENRADYEDDDEFDWQTDTPGIVDGDWPPVVTKMIFDVFDGDDLARVAEQVGAEVVPTVFNDDYLHIPPDKSRRLVKLCRDAGYTIKRDDKLIAKVGPP